MHPRRQRRRQVDADQDPLRGRTSTTTGEFLVDGEPVRFASPRDALGRGDRDRLPGPRDGAADVHLAELLPRRRADEGLGPAAALRRRARPSGSRASRCRRWASTSATRTSRSARSPAASGSRVAIARAIYFGARVLILDEPTSALGVKQAGVVLRYVVQARDRGVGVVSSSPTTRTTPSRSATTSCSSTGARDRRLREGRRSRGRSSSGRWPAARSSRRSTHELEQIGANDRAASSC